MTFFSKQSSLIIMLLSIISYTTYSQTLIIDDTANLKVGVYKTFKEFRYNSPSITTGFTVRPEEKWFRRDANESKDSSIHTFYHVFLPDSYSKWDTVWGFCDGKNVYVNIHRLNDKDARYEKIEYLGRYCLFHLWFGGSGGITPAALVFNLITKRTDSRLIKAGINFNNGYLFGLDDQNYIKTILSRDKEIYDIYKKDKERDKKSLYYVKLYSEKHRNEIKP